MMIVNSSAPGKAVLFGEYVVLFGAPAIATALNARVRITLNTTQKDFHTVTAPGYVDGTWRFLQDGSGEIDWQDELPDKSSFALLENIWQRIPMDASLRLSVSIDSNEFFAAAGGAKLGLGSSAAVSTALARALYCCIDLSADPADSFRAAKEAHTTFQGGRGSGVDIATSFHGGLLEFRKESDMPPRQLTWPAGLAYRFLWSGHPASTRNKLRLLRDTAHNRESTLVLGTAAEDIASIWSTGAVERIMGAMRHYMEALRQFDVDHDLGIFDAGHAGLVEMAAASDLVYKPCGAGGGDIGAVFGADEESVIEFCRQAKDHDFVQLDLQPDAQGVQVRIEQEVE